MRLFLMVSLGWKTVLESSAAHTGSYTLVFPSVCVIASGIPGCTQCISVASAE